MSATVQLITSLDEDAWDDLLSFIEERRVIPIIGPDHSIAGLRAAFCQSDDG